MKLKFKGHDGVSVVNVQPRFNFSDEIIKSSWIRQRTHSDLLGVLGSFIACVWDNNLKQEWLLAF